MILYNTLQYFMECFAKYYCKVFEKMYFIKCCSFRSQYCKMILFEGVSNTVSNNHYWKCKGFGGQSSIAKSHLNFTLLQRIWNEILCFLRNSRGIKSPLPPWEMLTLKIGDIMKVSKVNNHSPWVSCTYRAPTLCLVAMASLAKPTSAAKEP